MKRPHRPGDFAQRATLILDMVTGNAPRNPEPQPETPLIQACRNRWVKGRARRRLILNL